MPRKLAPTIGIAVDPRRQNISEESLTANVARLKEYHSRLILFPRRNGKEKKGDASADAVKAAKGSKANGFGAGMLTRLDKALPITNDKTIKEVKVADAEATEDAYRKLRLARSDARLIGVREKRSKAKDDEADAKKK